MSPRQISEPRFFRDPIRIRSFFSNDDAPPPPTLAAFPRQQSTQVLEGREMGAIAVISRDRRRPVRCVGSVAYRFYQSESPFLKKKILFDCWLDCLLMTRDCHAQATSSSSSENQVHGATKRPASATVRRHDREEVGNWASLSYQPPTKTRPASARPVRMRSLYERIGRSVCRGETDAFWRCSLRARRSLLCESTPASGIGFELHTIQSTTSSTSVSTGTG